MYNQLHIFNKGKKQIITTLLLVTSGSRETNQNDHTARERTFLWVNYCVSVCVWLEKACCCAAAVHWLADVSSVQGRPALPQSAQAPPAAVRSCHGNQTVQCWVWGGGALSTAAANGTAPSNQMRLHNELVMKSPHGCSACVLGPV